MESIRRVASEPGGCGISDVNGLQVTEEDEVIDGVKSCTEVEEEENGEEIERKVRGRW